MLVYMSHPNHGTHIAYSQTEVDTCKANGWKVIETPRTPNQQEASRKRGRPRKVE